MNLNNETFFKMLSDNTRLRALMLMQRMGELCVCELTDTLNLSQPKISRHLALLRENKLVETRRDGQWMYYQIDTSLPQWAINVLQQTLSGIGGEEQYESDYLLLKNSKLKENSNCSKNE
jgi:ArsR family transcriptional regulator, arsenate/arsenite/antimonite-responsive transcriptional repressor